MNVYIKSSLWVLIFFVNTLTYASKLPEWEIVPAQSEITFTGTQNGAPVTGRFKKFTGQIFADPSNYKTGSIDITIDMNSIAAPFEDIVTTLASLTGSTSRHFLMQNLKLRNLINWMIKPMKQKGF